MLEPIFWLRVPKMTRLSKFVDMECSPFCFEIVKRLIRHGLRAPLYLRHKIRIYPSKLFRRCLLSSQETYNNDTLDCRRNGYYREEHSVWTNSQYPSYFQDIMGDVFSMGFGPFRWVCASNLREDLKLTDEIACDVLDKLINDKNGRYLSGSPNMYVI